MMTDRPIEEMTVSEIKNAIKNDIPPSEVTIQTLEKDTRSSVKHLAKQIRRRKRDQAKEEARLEKMCALESKLRAKGLTYIAGVDEAGRGPLAGPVIAAAAILPSNARIAGLNDSKKLSEQKREQLFDEIQSVALAIGIGEATPTEIDNLNIRNATHLAMRRALDQLSLDPDRVLIDGNALPESRFNEMAIIGGDRKSVSIAAASIIAKVTRDRIMGQYDKKYPAYGFAQHKGYGSAQHLEALHNEGPTPIHRRSFAGVPSEKLTLSEVGDIFAEGIAAARNLAELEAIANTIASATSELSDQEVTTLREHYLKKRTSLQRPGNMGETLAADFLREKGYTILKKNYRAVGGEIDIIAQKDNTQVFVEVKTATQRQFGTPKTWVTPKKQNQIIRVAKAYLKQTPIKNKTPRFDVIGILLSTKSPQVEHIEGAFTETLKP